MTKREKANLIIEEISTVCVLKEQIKLTAKHLEMLGVENCENITYPKEFHYYDLEHKLIWLFEILLFSDYYISDFFHSPSEEYFFIRHFCLTDCLIKVFALKDPD